MEINKRYRVNVSTTAKGIFTFDATVEITANIGVGENAPNMEAIILLESDSLVAKLKARYPIVEEEKKQ